MASENEWLWYGRSRYLLGYTEERVKAHKNQFVNNVQEILQKDFPGFKFKVEKEYCYIQCFDWNIQRTIHTMEEWWLKAIEGRRSFKKKAINIGLKMTVNAPVNDYLRLGYKFIGY